MLQIDVWAFASFFCRCALVSSALFFVAFFSIFAPVKITVL